MITMVSRMNYYFFLFISALFLKVSIQRGLSSEDLLYPFDRQFWYKNYKDLLGSRPIDPHSVTYQEIMYVLLTFVFIFSICSFIFSDLNPII